MHDRNTFRSAAWHHGEISAATRQNRALERHATAVAATMAPFRSDRDEGRWELPGVSSRVFAVVARLVVVMRLTTFGSSCVGHAAGVRSWLSSLIYQKTEKMAWKLCHLSM